MYKPRRNKGLFDEEFTQERLSAMGNPLEVISKVIDFELFRNLLESKFLNTNKKNNAGAKPYDVVILFKILILQRYYGLGDSQVEYQILDRISFKTFLGYKNHAKVDTKSKFINTYTVTDASVHNSQALDDLLTEKDKDQDKTIAK